MPPRRCEFCPPASATCCLPPLLLQVGEAVRSSGAEAAHLPGFRYLYQEEGRGEGGGGAGAGIARASPRAKVSAMTHHARALAAALRSSLGGGYVCDGVAGSPSHHDGGGGQVLQVLARSSHDCGGAAWQSGEDGRRLLAVWERRSERQLGEAAEVMRAFAAEHFLM